MSERKFARNLGKPGTAAQLRETVSQVVKETTVLNKPQLVEPLDFESFILKNKTALQNDPQRELLMFPQDDITPIVLPRRHRTLTPTTPTAAPNYPLLTRACLHSYSTNWHLVHYKYHGYSMGYTELPHVAGAIAATEQQLREDLCEVDVDADAVEDGRGKAARDMGTGDGVQREGWLLKGPEIGSDRIFMNLAASKSFKRRYCHLHREIDGTYLLVLYKDERMRDTKLTVVMDFCTDVIANNNNNHADSAGANSANTTGSTIGSSGGTKRGGYNVTGSVGSMGGKFCFELRMTAGHKSYVLAAETAQECAEWVRMLGLVLVANRVQEEKRAASLERDRGSGSPEKQLPPTSQPNYGTLKGLEQSMNPQLIKYARETDTSIAHARRENRNKLFYCYVPVANDFKTAKQQWQPPLPHRPTPSQGKTPLSHSASVNTASTQQPVNCTASTSLFGFVEKPDPYKEVFGHRVLLRCDRLKFRLQQCFNEAGDCDGQLEPYYTCLCLYDAKLGKKITENFYFDLNEETVRGMAGCANAVAANVASTTSTSSSPSHPHPNLPTHLHTFSSRPLQAVLSVTNVHCDIFIVVRIEKVLQAGTIASCADPYVRATHSGLAGGKPADAKQVLKVQRGVQAFCQRLGSYRMPFGWAAKPLFRLYSNDLDTNCDFPAIYRQESNKLSDEDLLKLLSDYRKPDKFSKLTVIPGTLQIKIEPITEQIPNVLTTSLAPLLPFPNPPTSLATLEIAELDVVSETDVHPYSVFLNHLYVYPNMLNFDTQKVFTRARNIACTVELRDSDAEGITPLQCIYSRPGYPSLTPSHPLTTRATCAVLHHTTTPTWYDEIKVLLPTHLLPTHHLLFTFQHVSCDVSKRCTAVDSCVGFAWLPLLDRGRLVVGAGGSVQLAVATTLPAGYLSVKAFGLGKGNAGPDITFIDSQRPLFTVTCHLHSTVNTMDHHLANFFHLTEHLLGEYTGGSTSPASSTRSLGIPIIPARPSDSETCKILKALHAVYLRTLITFLPTLLDQLWQLLLVATSGSSAGGGEVGVNVVRVVVNLVHMVCAAGRKTILDSYVRYVFVTPQYQPPPQQFIDGNLTTSSKLTTVHEEICKHLPNILDPSNTDFLVIDKFMDHADFFFEITVKSMAQHLLTTGRIKMHRHERFPKEFHDKIEAVVEIVILYILNKHKDMPTETRELNKSLANFMKKLLSLTDRGFTFHLLHLYFVQTTPSPSHTHILHNYRLQLLAIICAHEHYLALCLPLIHTRLSPRSSTTAINSTVGSMITTQHQHGQSGRSSDFSNEYVLGPEWCKVHYPVGMLLGAVRNSLNEVTVVRRMGLAVLRGVVGKHDYDNRFESKGQRSRIALIYIPWLSIVLDNHHRLCTSTNSTLTADDQLSGYSVVHRRNHSNNHLFGSSSKTGGSVSDHSTTAPLFHRFTMHLEDKGMRRESVFFEAIAGQAPILNGHSSISLSESELSTLSGNTPIHISNKLDNQSCFSEETTIVRPADTNSVDSGSEGTVCNRPGSPVKNGVDGYGIKGHTRGISGSQSNQPLHQHRFDKFTTTETQDILIVFMFVVKYMGDDQLIAYWHKCPDVDVVQFFGVLDICLDCFRYVGKRNIVVQKPNVVENGMKAKAAKAHTLPARMNPSEMTNHQESSGTLVIHTKDTRDNLITSENDLQRNKQAILEQHLAKEIGLIVLDCLGLYCMHFRNTLLQSDGDNPVMRRVFDIFLTFLRTGQGETLFKHVFAALRSYINNYSIVLFQGNAILCGKLCSELLRLCNSRLPSIRQESCALLYLLMRSNFEFTVRRGITRVHLQVIVSVSQMLGSQAMVGQGIDAERGTMGSNFTAGGGSEQVGMVGLNSARFQESLSMINSYATSDKAMKGTGFPVEVKDLTKRVRTVLMATVQMREHHHDPEMLVDLQHSLANSYASTPELRHTWLDAMTGNHARDGNYSEAACCQLHIAALMAEYLKLRQVQSWGASAFSKISANIARDETSLKLDTGVQDVQYTEYLLLEQLETCAEYLDKAERYEVLAELYKLIIPILERKRNYELLKQAYQYLAGNYEKIISANKSGRRMLGRYYRIGFYGQSYFEDDSGIEYIYKEPKLTSLSEISERLNRQYCEKFGSDVVKMIQDSIPVNATNLDQKFAYIQVTHVTPYFEKSELEDRLTDFEQNHDINCFMFETPFTKDGRARGNPEAQWKRRTILKTSYTFPYVAKRIPVTGRRSTELTPIEVAIDEMQMRVTELEDVVFSRPTDAKKLQLRLQGSVCVQVNAGPLAYANAFLAGGDGRAVGNEEKVEELKDIYKDFLKICYSALQVNGRIISSDQTEYQEVLCQNYRKLNNSLSSLFGESLWPHEDTGSFKRNSTAVFSSISGTSQNSSTA